MAHCRSRPTDDAVRDAAGRTTETLLFLCRAGLLPEAQIDAPLQNATLSPDLVRRLRFIQRAQTLGFALHEIRELLAISDGPGSGQEPPQPLLIASQVEAIDAKLVALMRLRQALMRLKEHPLSHAPRPDCPILAALQDDAGD